MIDRQVIAVYITHFAVRDIISINDVLIDQLYKMRDTTPMDRARLHVVMWTDDAACLEDVRGRAPAGVEVVLNDRAGRPDSQPSMRNKVLELARTSGCQAFVLLHNDVRPARGWLELLVRDWRWAEERWGRDSSVVSPRLIPYHLTAPHPSSGVHADSDLWRSLPAGRDVMLTDRMVEWCRAQQPDEVRFIGGEVTCPESSSVKYDGRELMMFIASPRFFDDVGDCDESMTGFNYDDTDWGIRAFMAGKRNLQSSGSCVGHIGAFTLNIKAPISRERPRADNAALFVAKWGSAIWDEMHAGLLWPRLQREQRAE